MDGSLTPSWPEFTGLGHSASLIGKPTFNEPNILRCLHSSYLISSTFCLHRNNVVTTMFIDSYIKLIDLDLANASYSCAKMIL